MWYKPKDNVENRSSGDLLECTCTTKKDPTLSLTAKKTNRKYCQICRLQIYCLTIIIQTIKHCSNIAINRIAEWIEDQTYTVKRTWYDSNTWCRNHWGKELLKKFLSSMGISSSSGKNSSSREHIRELEHIIATQEADAKKASDMFHEELNEIFFPR